MGAMLRRVSGYGRTAALLSMAAVSVVVLTVAAVAISWSSGVPAAKSKALTAASSGAAASRVGVAVAPELSPFSLKLSAAARKACPAAAAACVDLAAHLTWLQSGGRIIYGPVQMEPGPPGTANATPRGTFHVLWKGGPHLISNEYNEPMPYAVFFAAGGFAFHAGSLTESSHGCVHLTLASALYYNEHLPIGAEVVVF
jgi:predicted amidohydrolase